MALELWKVHILGMGQIQQSRYAHFFVIISNLSTSLSCTYLYLLIGLQLKVSSHRLVKPGIEPATSGLQGEEFIIIHYTTASPLVAY